MIYKAFCLSITDLPHHLTAKTKTSASANLDKRLRIFLIANIVIDLALSPKSNSAYVAMDKALADLRSSGNLPIPRHLRDGHYAGSKELGNAQNYKYPHNYPGNWVNQDYLPDKLKHASYFIPNENGKYERALGATKRRLINLRKSDIGFKKLRFSLEIFSKCGIIYI